MQKGLTWTLGRFLREPKLARCSANSTEDAGTTSQVQIMRLASSQNRFDDDVRRVECARKPCRYNIPVSRACRAISYRKRFLEPSFQISPRLARRPLSTKTPDVARGIRGWSSQEQSELSRCTASDFDPNGQTDRIICIDRLSWCSKRLPAMTCRCCLTIDAVPALPIMT